MKQKIEQIGGNAQLQSAGVCQAEGKTKFPAAVVWNPIIKQQRRHRAGEDKYPSHTVNLDGFQQEGVGQDQAAHKA